LYCVKDGKHEDAEEFLGFYLDALDEELVELNTYISTHKLASARSVGEGAQLATGQIEVGKRDYISPISRIFGGRSCSTIRALNQPDTITVEDWRLLRLNIQVRFSLVLPFLPTNILN
jgi:ubiquitin carboxyl-terminal hydrolase 10